jgi:hypothetical protein
MSSHGNRGKCDICGKPLGPHWVKVVHKNEGKKSGEDFHMELHWGKCYRKYLECAIILAMTDGYHEQDWFFGFELPEDGIVLAVLMPGRSTNKEHELTFFEYVVDARREAFKFTTLWSMGHVL